MMRKKEKRGENKRNPFYIFSVVAVCLAVTISAMPIAIAEAANTVSIEDATLTQGTSIDIPIRLLNSTGVGGGSVTLTFDPAIVSVTNVTVGDFDTVFNVEYAELRNGSVLITAMKSGQDLTGDLTFATVTLHAVGVSGSCELGLSAELTTRTGAPVSANIDNGTFAILSYDNIVSSEDVTLTQGTSIDVPIRLLNSTGVGGGSVTLTFDPAIVSVTNVTVGDFDTVFNVEYAELRNGSVLITAMKSGQDLTGDLTFATVTLHAVGVSGSCELGLSAELTTRTGAPVSANVDNGTFAILASTPIFDTGAPAKPYPSIFGIHNGTITPNKTITVHGLYTYPCAGTGGHTEYVRIWRDSVLDVNATWEGYRGDWHNITFNEPFVLYKNKTYNYTIITGSYPQIIHNRNHTTLDGSFINCTEFVDANGNKYNDWIPAFKLFL